MSDDGWDRVLEAWDDDAAHDAYIGAMTALGQLGDAAARYRSVAADPLRGESAKKRLARIAILAEHMLAATAERPDPAPLRRKLTIVATILCAMLLALMFWALQRWR